MTGRRGPGWLGAALIGAGGFLCGILLVAILGGAKPVIKSRTITVAATTGSPGGAGGGRFGQALVPQLVGERLDAALDELQRVRLRADVDGGGFFGIVDEHNWVVQDQDPAAGTPVDQGSIVRLEVDRP